VAEHIRTVLGIDTSGPVLGLALAATGRTPLFRDNDDGLRHTENLLPVIDAFLKESGHPEPPDGIVVSRGPGSFTGLRIGMATAKALGLAWNRPVVSIDTLHGLALTEALAREQNARDHGARGPVTVVPVLDARKSRYYTAVFLYAPEPTGSPLVQLTRQRENLDISLSGVMKILQGFDRVVLPGFAVSEMTAPDNVDDAAVVKASGARGIATLGLAALGEGQRDDPYQGPEYLRDEDIGTRKKGPLFSEDS
jgi:tRNA threonylcarbamoyl adenosine modification protein YeaZ